MPAFLARWRLSIGIVVGLHLVTLLIMGAPRIAAVMKAATTSSDSLDSAFPNAEVLHVVSQDSASRTTETWIDQISGDVTVKVTDKDGNLREAIMRRGLTLTQYWLHPELQAVHDTYRETRKLLSKDDPILLNATNHLDLYRRGLEDGTVTKVGEETFQGQPAIKVQAFPNNGEHIAYLSPDTLYPFGIQFPHDEAAFTISYLTIETLQRAEVPSNVFAVELPPTDYHELYQRLSAEDLAQFTAYPVVNLGTTFRGYTLELVERYQPLRLPSDAIKFDNVSSIYHKRNAAGEVEGRIEVTVRKPPTDEERAGRAQAEQAGHLPPAEQVTVNGEAAQLRGGTTLTIERPDSLITIHAPDRESTLAAGAALQPAAAAPMLVLPR